VKCWPEVGLQLPAALRPGYFIPVGVFEVLGRRPGLYLTERAAAVPGCTGGNYFGALRVVTLARNPTVCKRVNVCASVDFVDEGRGDPEPIIRLTVRWRPL
jgi:hypothetical protein